MDHAGVARRLVPDEALAIHQPRTSVSNPLQVSQCAGRYGSRGREASDDQNLRLEYRCRRATRLRGGCRDACERGEAKSALLPIESGVVALQDTCSERVDASELGLLKIQRPELQRTVRICVDARREGQGHTAEIEGQLRPLARSLFGLASTQGR